MQKWMHKFTRLLKTMTRWERWALAGLSVLCIGSLVGLLRVFYVENTVLMPSSGGTYIEGSVGDFQPLNPWFTVRNDVNRDIVSLVFAGLLRYDPETRKIEEDLATMKLSADGRTYTLQLKDDLYWHDSTSKDPHPVTADDVLYTFTTIQNPQFPNVLLQQNFRGVVIEKLDGKTVRFTLEQPYSFFPSNLTIGLLPKSAFAGIPVSKLDLATDFGFHPVGAGPYRFKSLAQTDVSSEVTLERFDRPTLQPYRLDRIVFRIFPDYSSLLSDLSNLQGVRLVPKDEQGNPQIPRRFESRRYFLPQYVALFFNLDHKNLQDEKLRLGLQLGTDKKSIGDSVHESVLVDTPLLEINTSDWRYQFDADAAQRALFQSHWNLPEKLRLQRLLEQADARSSGPLHAPAVVYLDTGAVLTITGSLVDIKPGMHVNGLSIFPHPTLSGAWIVTMPTIAHGTGALHPGQNVIRLTDANGKILDSTYVFRAQTQEEAARAAEEQRLVRRFLLTRSGKAGSGDVLTTDGLTLERGMLRERQPSDSPSVRRNDAGQQLELHLLTSPSPPEYRKVATEIRRAWADLGVRVIVEVPATQQDFQDRLLRRDYDVVLFGQSLLDNLDSYAYWHSSGVQKVTGKPSDLRQDAYNLSQYSSFKADTLLETVRRTADEKERAEALKQFRAVLNQDVPAIFLYSPQYTFAYRKDVLGIELGTLSMHSDRFLTLHKWYVHQSRVFLEGKSWLSIGSWLVSLLFHSGLKNP